MEVGAGQPGGVVSGGRRQQGGRVTHAAAMNVEAWPWAVALHPAAAAAHGGTLALATVANGGGSCTAADCSDSTRKDGQGGLLQLRGGVG
jgi:hypothetical protein